MVNLNQQLEPTATAVSDRLPAALRNWQLLVIEDDAEIRKFIGGFLARGPYDIALCGDAESALVAIDRQGPFDAIICDVMLPGMSGLDLIGALRGKARTRGTPVLMISGHGNYATDGRTKTAGASLFLNKPFTISQLRTAVNQLVPRTSHVPAFGA